MGHIRHGRGPRLSYALFFVVFGSFLAAPALAQISCDDNQACKAGEKCVENRCQTVAPNASCERDQDCGNEQTCKDAFCVNVSEAEAAAPPAIFRVATPDKAPDLNVPIPGLTLEAGTEGGNPLLAQYIVGIYRYAVSASAIAATIMFIWGAFRYLLGASMGDVARGKQIMTDAVIGMLLVLGAVAILRIVNPETVELENLQLAAIRTENYESNAPSASVVAEIKTDAERTTPPTSAGGLASPGNAKGCGEDSDFLIPFPYIPDGGDPKIYFQDRGRILVDGRIKNCPGAYPVILYLHGNKGARTLEATNGAITATKLAMGKRKSGLYDFQPVIFVFPAAFADAPKLWEGTTIEDLKKKALATLESNPETRGVTFSSVSVAGHSGAGCNNHIWGTEMTQTPLYAILYADTCVGRYDNNQKPTKLIAIVSDVMANSGDLQKFASAHDMEHKGRCRLKYYGPQRGCYEHSSNDWFAYRLFEANHGWPILLSIQFALDHWF